MGLHTTDVIVLRRYFFRETSIIVSCLSESHGKLKGLVKGLRAQPNRYRSAMEPLTINRIVFYDTRSSQLHLISQCELLNALDALQRDLNTLRLGAFCVELVDGVVPLEDPQPAIFYLLRQTLERLAAGADLMLLRVHFITRLLRLAGFQPQLSECVGCGVMLDSVGFWSVQQGGLLCQGCLHEDSQAEPVGSLLLDGLRELSQADQPLPLQASLLPTLSRRLEQFLQWRLERPLKTLEPAGSRFEAKTSP